MHSDLDGLSLVLAQRTPAGRAKVILQSDFSAASVERIDEARCFVVNSFAAVMAPNGQLATKKCGRIYDPLRAIPPGSLCDFERGRSAFVTGTALFREMDNCRKPRRLARIMKDICATAGAVLVALAIGLVGGRPASR